jgi:hypothetical protein
VSAIVQIMPMSDIVAALLEASVGPKGKPTKIVACGQQVFRWANELDTRHRITGDYSRADRLPTTLNIMGVPVECGPDGPVEMVWSQVVQPRVKIVSEAA